MNRKIKFLILSLVLIILSFFFLFKIDPYDLGDNYYFISKEEALDIGFTHGKALIYKGEKKNYYVFHAILLEGDIKGVNHDNSFIVVHVMEENINQCYIIEKNIDKIYGPFGEEEYREEAQSLGVSKKLKCVK